MTSTTYSVPDVSCGHCVETISRAVGRIPSVATVAVDLATRTVTVRGEQVDDAAVRAAIDEAGYHVLSVASPF